MPRSCRGRPSTVICGSATTPSRSLARAGREMRTRRSAGIRMGVQGLGRDRQYDGENAALAGHVLHLAAAAVHADALAGDGQTEAEAGLVDSAPLEGTEPLLRLAGRQTTALVLDLDEDATPVLARAQRDVALGVGELERVLQEVGDGGRKQVAVDIDRDAVLHRLDGEIDVPRFLIG